MNETLPAPSTCRIILHTESFRRTVNGAWVAGGSKETETEIALAELNTPNGAHRLNPGRCGFLQVIFEDGTGIFVCGANDPIRTNGFGSLCTIKGGSLINQPHPLLPNIAPTYSRVQWFSDETLAGAVEFAA